MCKRMPTKNGDQFPRGKTVGADTHTAEDPPKIEFPCDYPIKVLGDAVPDFTQIVIDVVMVHAPTLDPSTVTFRDSGKGRFRAVTLIICATGVAQLEAIFEDLKATGIVKMVI